MKWLSGKPDRPRKRGPKKKRGRPRKVVEAEKKPAGRPITEAARKKALVYVEAQASGMKRGDALEKAGYNRGDNPDRHPVVIQARQSIESQRDELQQTDGFRLKDVAGRFKDRAMNEKVSPRDQTDNDKALVSVLGYAAEKKVSISNTSLLLEFTDLTSEDLMRTRERLMVNNED